MIKAIIIDDEMHCRKTLSMLLKEYCPDVQLMEQCSDAQAGLEAIEKFKPDLVFLDIEMPHMNGFEMLEQFSEIPFAVVFTTGYDQYAIKAFKFSALDYLLKPVEPKRLADAIQKLHFSEAREVMPNGEHINRSMLTENDQVFVKDGERCWFVKLNDIRLFESVGNYAKVFFATNKPLILKSLNALEERLDEKMFFRANRKHIVNLRMIDKIEPYFNGGLLLELKGGEKIEVSRRQTVKFKEMMSL